MHCQAIYLEHYEATYIWDADTTCREVSVNLYDILTGSESVAKFLAVNRSAEQAIPENAIRMYESTDDVFFCEPGVVHLTDFCPRGIEHAISFLVKEHQVDGTFMPSASPAPRWSNLKLAPIELSMAGLNFKKALESIYVNGEVFLSTWEAAPAEFDACLACHPIYSLSKHPLADLLNNTEFQDIAPLESASPKAAFLASWNSHDSFSIRAELASMLYSGGAYSSLSPDHQKAWKLAHDLIDDVSNQDYSGIFAFVCYQPWTDWFFDVAWDFSLVLVSVPNRRILLLFATDTD